MFFNISQIFWKKLYNRKRERYNRKGLLKQVDKQQYDTIKLQINQEKEQILKEVYELTAEKRKIEQKKNMIYML